MWICPKCGAVNFTVGPCQCCGYTGIEYTIKPDTHEPSGTGNPLPPLSDVTC